MDKNQGDSSLTNAATMSQSSALEPENFCFRRKCKRKTTAILASAIKTALVAIIARDAEVVMVGNNEMSRRREKDLVEVSVQKQTVDTSVGKVR